MDIKEYITSNYYRIKDRTATWQDIAGEINDKFGIMLSSEAVRKRNKIEESVPTNREYETIYGNGMVEAQTLVNLTSKEKENPALVLAKMGYNPDEWEMQQMTFSNWEQHTKNEGTKSLYSVRFKIKPLAKDGIDRDIALQVAKEVFGKAITPLKIKDRPAIKGLDENKLFEIPAIELHLGKMAWQGDTGQAYDKDIANERFEHIAAEILQKQDIEKCGTAVLYIGNDFFNSDTIDNTTTKGTTVMCDVRWKKLFNLGLKMNVELLLALRERFNKVDVRIVQGNHAKMAEFYLYIALQQYFKDDKIIEFSDNYQETQCYSFGYCAIFTNHGDSNLKRLVKTVPAEFYEEWGKSKFRELHLGHLHHEIVVDDDSGMITRRIGSPSGTDDWHYHERFVGSTQKHQLFIWNKDKGMETQYHINFDNNDKKKVLSKKV